MTPCPQCNGTTKIIKSAVCRNGSRRQRRQCKACHYRWTTHDGEPPAGFHYGMQSCPECGNPATTIESRERSDGSRRQRRECSSCGHRWTTYTGKPQQPVSSASPASEPQPGTAPLSCHQCAHWHQGRCQMGFPDPLEEGPEFAVDCATFLPIDMSSTH